MKRTLLATLGLLALASAPSLGSRSETALGGFGPAFDVRVDRGRAALVQASSVKRVGARDGSVPGRGDAALGLGTAAAAEIAWRSRASMRLGGPAEIEWTNLDLTGELQLIIGSAASVELESRRTGVRIELSQGWGLQAREAALRLEETPNGGWVVRHHGGEPVRVRSRVPRQDGAWPRVLNPGDVARLEPRRR